MTQLLCPWSSPLYFFYSPDAPALLYYAYIPIAVLSIIFGLFVLFKDKFSLLGRLLFFISLFFSLWILNIIVEWASVDPLIQMFSWQITGIFEIAIFLFSIYFLYVFVENSDLQFIYKVILSGIALTVVIFSSTKFNISQFYLTEYDCGGIIGYLWYFIYTFEVITLFFVVYYITKKLIHRKIKLKEFLVGLGMFCFLGIFFLSNFWGELTKVYEINLVGPIGMVIFLGLLTYLIVRFGVFHFRIIGANALVFALWMMVFSLLFITNFSVLRIIISITFIFLVLFGILLVRSVTREVKQKEEIQQLNERLEGLVHFISHQVKGYLTKSQSVFSVIVDGDYGEVNPDLKRIAKKALIDNREGVETVMNILNSANIKKGTLKFIARQFNFKDALVDVVNELRPSAEQKNLTIETNMEEGADYMMIGDKEQVAKHAIRNIIDNSIKYTGVGISEEDKPRLFTEGGRGTNSVKVNVSSTGYGLYFAREIVEAHKGRIWAESEGPGHGSTFYVELPTKII